MYTVDIELDFDETITITTSDFNKVVLLQKFVEQQEFNGWEEEEAEDEILTFTDNDGVTWYYDADEDDWYVVDDEEEDQA